MKLQIYELLIPDTEAALNISVVEQPAIELNFYYFNKELEHFLFYDDDKRIVVGPAMVPNKFITRNGKMGPYVCYFSQDTIQKFKERLLAERSIFSNINHSEKLEDIQLIEIWTKDFEIDKSVNYGYKDEPIGTLFAMYKVNCQKTWEKIKRGSLKGFSIEGYFNPEDTGKTIESKQLIRNQFNSVYRELQEDQWEILDKILHLKQFRPAIWQELKDDNDFKKRVEEEFQTYTDYPDYMKEAAKRGIEQNKKVGNKCATQVGKIRAQQLANGEPISLDTIKRIHSYISRAMEYYNPEDTEACGTISINLWGGPQAGEWAQRKLEQIEKQEMAKEKAITVDIDDTLVIDGKPNEGLIDILNNSSERIIVLTSRNNLLRKGTEKLLNEIGLRWDNLIMRKSGDSTEHKVKALEMLLSSYDITKSYENNPDVLKEMKTLGINAKMPNQFIIEPKPNETEDEFIERCMIVETENYERDQAFAICKSKWSTFAEVGERGAIVKSPKAPKADTPNPNPKGEGTAKGDASTTRGAEVSERVEKILKEKSDDFNERYKDKLGYGVNTGMLKSVYQRGVGAFNVSHSPKVKSAEQWALARVNAFLYLVKEGRPESNNYVNDNDLLPKDHPKSENK